MGDIIEYDLIAQVNGQQVFNRRYPDTYEVQEVGLGDAEDVVSRYLESGDLEPEEISYISQVKRRKARKKRGGNNVNRDCMVMVLGAMVHNELLSLPAADHYLRVVDKMLEDGTRISSVEEVLEALNG